MLQDLCLFQETKLWKTSWLLFLKCKNNVFSSHDTRDNKGNGNTNGGSSNNNYNTDNENKNSQWFFSVISSKINPSFILSLSNNMSMAMRQYDWVLSDKKTITRDFPYCSKLFLWYYDCVYEGRIIFKVRLFGSFETTSFSKNYLNDSCAAYHVILTC